MHKRRWNELDLGAGDSGTLRKGVQLVDRCAFQLALLASRLLSGLAFRSRPDWVAATLNITRHTLLSKYIRLASSSVRTCSFNRKQSNYPSLCAQLPEFAVWVYWAQGWQAAPDLVLSCLASVQRVFGQSVVLLDAESAWALSDLPEVVMDWRADDRLNEAHYSDLLRINLLKQFGGLWVDATVFVAHEVGSIEQQEGVVTCTPVYDARRANVSRQRFTSYLIGGTSSTQLWATVEFMLLRYWANRRVAVHYHLLDYCISIALAERVEETPIVSIESVRDPHALVAALRADDLAAALAFLRSGQLVFKLDWRLSLSAAGKSLLNAWTTR